MNKIFWQILITITFLITACGQSTPIPVIDSTTSTPSPLPTTTQTALPTATPTASITPLPTIPTFTPTFDVSTIVTVTPAPKAECPKILVDESAQLLVKELKSLKAPIIIDLTNDGVSEIIVDGNRDIQRDGDGSINIYGCQNGFYIELLHIQTFSLPLPWVATVQDLNRNGIIEIVTVHNECMMSRCKIIKILEWKNSEFVDISRDPSLGPLQSETLDDIQFADIDGNGTIEVLISEGLPIHPDSLSQGPLRTYTSIHSWDGDFFKLKYVEMLPPDYRFQAIQDADKKAENHELNRATELYQEAISNDQLKNWSPEIAENYHAWVNSLHSSQRSPMPIASDTTEYPQLAAYAYYRIMLIHIVQGHESDASTVYNTLQEKFGNDQYSHPYIEMASAFWEAYQSTHKMYDGCAAAIQYAVEHPEILIPLGSDYHGSQSHQYKPEDVCPFR